MMGGGGFGSPQTFSQGGKPAPYVPQAQGQMDQIFQNTLAGFPTTPQQTPAGFYYPYAQNTVSNYFNPSDPTGPAATTIPIAQNASFTAADMGMQGANALQGAGQSLLSTAFDPQGALRARGLQQAMDAANAANASAGLGMTPYGASNVGNAARNFGIDWENNLLQRMISGGQAGGNLLQAAPSLYAQSGALPYNTGVNFGNNQFQAFNQATNLGNNQFQLPQQVLADIESYLGLGQSASDLALRGGNMGFNQTAQGIGGLLSGANSLFGGSGGGLLGGAGSLFGGGGGAGLAGIGADNLTGAAALPGFDTLGGTVGMGAIGGDFGGGGAAIDALSAAPMALS